MAPVIAARIVSVLFGTATAAITIKIGKALFQKEYARLFVVLVCFLPGAMFINSYINTDSIALFFNSLGSMVLG